MIIIIADKKRGSQRVHILFILASHSIVTHFCRLTFINKRVCAIWMTFKKPLRAVVKPARYVFL